MNDKFDPQYIDARNSTMNNASHNDGLPKEQTIEALKTGAEYLLDSDKVVPRIMEIISHYNDPSDIPQSQLEDAAKELGGYEPEMILAIAQVLHARESGIKSN